MSHTTPRQSIALAIFAIILAAILSGCASSPSSRYPIIAPIDPVTEEPLNVRH